MEQKQPVAFELVCVDIPAQENLRLGLQEGKNVVQDVPARVEQAVFRFTLDVQLTESNDAPRFSGPCAQGTPADRFVYLCWGERRNDVWQTLRRAKVLLGGIPAELVYAAIAAKQPLCAHITMTDAKGQPVAASLKPEMITWKPLNH